MKVFFGSHKSAPKRHVGWFSRFCTAHPCVRHTNTQTTLRAATCRRGSQLRTACRRCGASIHLCRLCLGIWPIFYCYSRVPFYQQAVRISSLKEESVSVPFGQLAFLTEVVAGGATTVLRSVVSVCPSDFPHLICWTKWPSTLIFSRAWVTTIARRGLKVNVMSRSMVIVTVTDALMFAIVSWNFDWF